MTTEAKASFLVEAQRALLASVLDRVVPPEGKLPGAGALGVADYIDGVVGKSAELKRLFAHGLAQIEIASQAMHSGDFAALSAEQKDMVLRRVEASEPRFFEALVRQTYNGYYTNPRVLELLGLEARPPQPRGYRVEMGDFSLIESVKKRGRAYREV
jgi:hypothetical protein